MNVLELLNKEKLALEKLNKYEILIGVRSSDKNRKNKSGVTNAELMFIHENGSPLRKIPSRPVLRLTIEKVKNSLLNKTIDRCVKGILEENWSEKEIDLEFDKLCLRIESIARKMIYKNTGILAPNAESTIAKKKSNHPLFDTGQLARSITCIYIKK